MQDLVNRPASKRSPRRRLEGPDDDVSGRRCYPGSSTSSSTKSNHRQQQQQHGLPDMNTMYMEMEGLSVERRALHDPLTGDTTVASPLAHPPSSSFQHHAPDHARTWTTRTTQSRSWRATPTTTSSKYNHEQTTTRDEAPIVFSDPCSDASVMTGMSQQELIRKKVRHKKTTTRKYYNNNNSKKRKKKTTIVQILPGIMLGHKKESPPSRKKQHSMQHKNESSSSPGRSWNYLMRTSNKAVVVTDDLSTAETSSHSDWVLPHSTTNDTTTGRNSIGEYSFPLLSRESGTAMLNEAAELPDGRGMGSFLLDTTTTAAAAATPEEEPLVARGEPVALVDDTPYRLQVVEPPQNDEERPRAVRFAKKVRHDDRETQPWDESEDSPTSVVAQQHRWTSPPPSAAANEPEVVVAVETTAPKSILRTSKFVPQARPWKSPQRASFLDRLEVSPIRPVRGAAGLGHPAEKHATSLYQDGPPVRGSVLIGAWLQL